MHREKQKSVITKITVNSLILVNLGGNKRKKLRIQTDRLCLAFHTNAWKTSLCVQVNSSKAEMSLTLKP